ncbi:MAG: OmpA family protein [Bacteroidia bacterium]|nr:OmpA family protein [Bacteroidia bacterium]
MKYSLSVLLLFISVIVFSQNNSEKFKKLIKKADTYYRLKNYTNSTATYSTAFRLYPKEVTNLERFSAACAFALDKNADSAFALLEYIVGHNNTLSINQLNEEADLKYLHKSKRWNQLLNSIEELNKLIESKKDQKLVALLDSILDQDQKYRSEVDDVVKLHSIESPEMKQLFDKINEIDSTNLIVVKKILDTRGWLSKEIIGENGSSTLFLVIQHADIQTQVKYLPMMQDAVKLGNASSRQLALLEDRVAVNLGEKQRYGTQLFLTPKTGTYEFYPIYDEKNVNKRRAEVGLGTIENYAALYYIPLSKKEEKNSTAKSNADFSSAIGIVDSIIGPVKVNIGIGKKLDYNYDNYVKESNSAWFKIEFDYDTTITFDLVPENPKDDFDFIFFKCSNTTCSSDLMSKKMIPERVCFSMNEAKYGSTGLSELASKVSVGAGYGEAYLAPVKVKAGDVYYLMVDFSANYRRIPSPFSIYFYNYWPHKKKAIVIDNINFESNKAILLQSSFVSLDKLVKQLNDNKALKIVIRGHTDNSGDEEKNKLLSEERAKAVMNYLILKKINPSRLSFKGMGSEQPINSNETNDGRKKNRRVDFIILNQ